MTKDSSPGTRLVLDRCKERLANLKSDGLLRTARTVDLLQDGRCRIGGRDVLNFGGNDYLGLAAELGSTPGVREVLLKQVGSTASAAVVGRSRHHDALETALSEFEDTEAALLFPSGYAANLGVIRGLVEADDVVFCDRDNHASIVDAIRGSEGKLLVYRRDRLDQLRNALQKRRSQFRRAFIITDGVFSMDGEVAPLPQLCDLAEEYDAAVVVDEAHGTGVLGSRGRGACDFQQVEDHVVVRIGTMSKAMGGIGGFAVGPSQVIELLRNVARTQFFSTALPPVICEAMRHALQIIEQQPERRRKLAQLVEVARRHAAIAGRTLIGNGVAPIVPIASASETVAVEESERLFTAGFFVPAIRPPTVARGTSRLRISLTCQHSESDVEHLFTALAELSAPDA